MSETKTRTDSNHDIHAHLKAADGYKHRENNGDEVDQDVGPFNKEAADRLSLPDLKDGSHTLPELEAHNRAMEKEHEDKKVKPLEIPWDADHVKEKFARGHLGHPAPRDTDSK